MFKEDYLNRNLDDNNLHTWYISDDKNVYATMMLKIIDEKTGKLENVCCHKEHRGKGLAQQLLDEIIVFSKQIGLDKIKLGTYDNLERAIEFYKKNGFAEQIDKRDNINKARYYELKLE